MSNPDSRVLKLAELRSEDPTLGEMADAEGIILDLEAAGLLVIDPEPSAALHALSRTQEGTS